MEGANQVGGSRLVGCSDENGLLLGSRPTVVRVALFFLPSEAIFSDRSSSSSSEHTTGWYTTVVLFWPICPTGLGHRNPGRVARSDLLQSYHSVPKYSEHSCTNIHLQIVLTLWDRVELSE